MTAPLPSALAGRYPLVPSTGSRARGGAADAGKHAARCCREQPDGVHVVAHGARGIGAIADRSDDKSDLGVGEGPPRETVSAAPIRKSTFTFSAASTCGTLDQAPKGSPEGGARPVGYGLPKKKAKPMPKSISAMPTAMS
jgi:hypothetical protein